MGGLWANCVFPYNDFLVEVMPEFLRLISPDQARAMLFSSLQPIEVRAQTVETASALDRVTAGDLLAPHPLPEFSRSTVDGYAVQAQDTFGASDSLPAYLALVGEVPMGAPPSAQLASGQCILIHTGGMLPEGANAVVMLEHTQAATGSAYPGDWPPAIQGRDSRQGQGEGSSAARGEMEVRRPVAEGENVIRLGEDVVTGQVVLRAGVRLRPAEIGGLMALGITSVPVAAQPRIGIISSGDEIVAPSQATQSGQVRDVNAYSLAAVIGRYGGIPLQYGIVADDPEALRVVGAAALSKCDVVVITAGSSASSRDRTAEVVGALGHPGVLVHGINTRPGKPTILGVCDGKAVIGLPGNPVSALVNAYLFVGPLIEVLLGMPLDRPRPTVTARLSLNLMSEAGREDWWPVKLSKRAANETDDAVHTEWIATPVFGRSNMIFSLAAADGLLRIPPEATGLAAGQAADVLIL
jgi:molybdopterin molybdotransferase